MLIDSGKVIKVGNPTAIADAYNEFNLRTSISGLEQRNKRLNNGSKSDEGKKFQPGQITKVETYNPKTKQKQNAFVYTEKIGVRYFIKAHNKLESPTVGLVFRDREGNQVFATNTPSMKIKLEDLERGQTIGIEFEIDNIFANGDYLISGALVSKDRSEVYHKINDVHVFEVGGWKFPDSIAHPKHKINVFKK